MDGGFRPSEGGESIPFIAEPGIVSLGDWRKKHPDTLVLLGDKSDVEKRKGG